MEKKGILRILSVIVIAALVCSLASGFATAADEPDAVTLASGVRSTTNWNIIDHTCTDIHQIPESAIEQAKADLHIGYGHTSHGSQLTTGMDGLVGFMNGLGYTHDLYDYNNGGIGGALDLRDSCFSGASDLGNPDRTSWADATQDYLDAHADLNVVIWSWCGQVSSATEADIVTYLDLMDGLEDVNPGVDFVYMTGHLDGTGLDGNLHLRNEQIRTYCNANEKILYDFADIETYDPDGTYFGDKIPNDNCDYDSDGDAGQDANWAQEWQDSHTEDEDWYSCSSAHSQPLNANQKAYAAWWLWAMLAGWDQDSGAVDTDGDGVYDPQDAFPDDPDETTDTDGDGVGNNADIDDDGDGVSDVDDEYPFDPTRWEAEGDAPGFGLVTILVATLVAYGIVRRKGR